MSTHNLCFEQKYEKYQSFFFSENFHFLVVKFSVYLNRHVFVMRVCAVCHCSSFRHTSESKTVLILTLGKYGNLIKCLNLG